MPPDWLDFLAAGDKYTRYPDQALSMGGDNGYFDRDLKHFCYEIIDK
jgi:hypothetical protein